MDALNYEKDSNDDGDDSDMHDETLCTVCLDTMTDADSKKLPCGHQFHTKCITQSFMKQQQPMRQCFYCRTARVHVRGVPMPVLLCQSCSRSYATPHSNLCTAFN